MSNREPGLRASRRIANLNAVTLVAATLAASLFVGLGAWAPPTSAGGAVPHPSAFPGSGWIPDVPVAADPVWTERNPSLTTAANGNLYMAFESNTSGSRDIYFTQSADGGQTWSAPVAVAVTARDEISPSIATDPFSGRTFIAYQVGISGATSMYVAYSDDGVSWTNVAAFVCGVYCDRPRIASEYWNGASNRQYIVFAGQLGAADWDLGFLRSTNQGASWSFLYESGNAFTDVRHQPALAVQHGTDGVDRVLVFYRYGSSFPGTSGRMEWSNDHGVTWNGPSLWSANVATPPVIAAAHDGDSAVIAYGTGSGGPVIWAASSDPTDLTWGTNTFWGQFTSGGLDPALGVDGDGSTDLTIGGAYHLISQAAGGPISYATAPVSLTGPSDWSVPKIVNDTGAAPSSVYPELTVASQNRSGIWYPAVAWTDNRTGNDDIYYTTPGTVAVGPINVTLDSVPTGLRVSLDGSTRIAPATYSVSAGPHTVGVASPQSGAVGWRYVFASWSDGGPIAHVINVTGNMTLSASFTTQVLLTITSARGGVSGGGWYDLGAIATITATSPQTGPPGTQYVFTGWTGDLVSSSSVATVTMDAPKAVTANWQTQYLLTVNSAIGAVSGAGWYPAGMSVLVWATTPQPGATGTRYEFAGWTGDATGLSPSISVVMNAPKTVTANWATAYLVVVQTAHGTATGGGWYRSASTATVRLTATEITEGGTVWEFTGWSGDASGTAGTVGVPMNGPKTVVATWQAKPTAVNGTPNLVLLGPVALLVAILLLVALLRRRRKAAPTLPPIQPMQGIGPNAPPYAPPTTPPPAVPPGPPPAQPPPAGPPA